MTQNEVKQEILNHLQSAVNATAKEMAEDLMWTDKAERNRLNKALTGLKQEGLIEATKVIDEETGVQVNAYTLTDDGFDAADTALNDLRNETSAIPQRLGDMLDHACESGKPQSIAKYMIVIDGETIVYNSAQEAQEAARHYASRDGERVDYYTLTAKHIGAFVPVTSIEFIDATAA